MELLIKTNDELRQYIANVVHEVDDETLLYDKMLPFLEQAQQSIEHRFIGTVELNDDEKRAACTLIAISAFYYAIPSLDLVLTPNGFGVVNSTNIAPASKERVERLRASLLDAYDKWTDNLLFALNLNEDWRNSDASIPFRTTLLWHLDDVADIKKESESLYDAFMRVQPLAVNFEQTIESDYLGRDLMSRMHALFGNQPYVGLDKDLFILAGLVRIVEKRWIAVHHRDRGLTCPKEHEIWHLMQRILLKLQDIPELYAVWKEEMGHLFSIAQSDVLPSKQGGCWL